MILVEQRLKELFETLPVQTIDGSDYKPAFDFGTHEDLLKYLKYKRKEGGKIYPLIWLETPIVKNGKEERLKIELKLVIATLTNSEISNTERLQLTFKTTLVPLYDNIQKALMQSGFTRILNADKNKRADFFNYGVKDTNKKTNVYNYGISDTNKEKHLATDIWDAIKFECDLEITECKQKNINY